MNSSDRAAEPGILMLVMAFPPKPVGGAELQCQRLAAGLVSNGVRVHVLTEGGAGLSPFESTAGIAVHRVFPALAHRWVSGLRSWARGLNVRRDEPRREDLLPYDPKDPQIQFRNRFDETVRYIIFLTGAVPIVWRIRREIDVVHVHIVPWMAFVGALLGLLIGKPVLVKESTVTGLQTARSLPFGHVMDRIVRTRCWFVSMTRAIHEALIAGGIPEARVFSIPNGVAVPEIVPPRRSSPPYTCLTVGNLSQGASKGFDVLFESWKLVLADFPDAELWVAGAGESTAFDGFLERLGVRAHVRFLGTVHDVGELCTRVAVVALPSRREGMSNALLEAMAQGAPVVATRVSGAEDLIVDGVSGALVGVDDVGELGKAIIRFFAFPDVARVCGEQGRATVLTTCRMEDVVQKYRALYFMLCGGVKGRADRSVHTARTFGETSV